MDKARSNNSEGDYPDSERYNSCSFLHMDASCEYLDMCVLIRKPIGCRQLEGTMEGISRDMG